MANTEVRTTGKLSVEFRHEQGKSAVRKLRAAGKIPGVVYGKGVEPQALALDPRALMGALDPEKRTNTVITMDVAAHDGPSGKVAGQQLTVMLRDWQRDAIRGELVHADFLRVRLDQEVHAVIPIVLTGKSEGVKLGGTLHQVYRQLEIACTPDKIPTKIEVSIDGLGMGDALHVRDVKLPPGVRALADAGTTICTVTAPKAEKVAEAAVEGAVAEGAAAAPAEGAKAEAGKPAAGAKEGEKAPAAAKGKKE